MIPMARVNSTGFEEADPASRNDMFINAPKNAAKPGEQSDDQPDPDRELAERDQPAEPAVRAVVEQGLDERAVPVERDGRAAGALAGIATACSQ